MRKIAASELLINDDGSIFHLHLQPCDLADKVILVGDPGRVELVASFFDTVERRVENREFVTVVGTYRGTRFTVVSTGIGTDNIDIVLNELDALANIDFSRREVREELRSLSIVRLGTTGAVQPDMELGSCVMSVVSLGLDSVLYYYAEAEKIRDKGLEEAFIAHTGWNDVFSRPYAVYADKGLVKSFGEMARPGITVSAVGFYAPQGRMLRLQPVISDMIEKFEHFSYNGLRITNIEMESSAVAALSALMGHKAVTLCTVIAQRSAESSDVDYGEAVKGMVKSALAILSR